MRQTRTSEMPTSTDIRLLAYRIAYAKGKDITRVRRIHLPALQGLPKLEFIFSAPYTQSCLRIAVSGGAQPNIEQSSISEHVATPQGLKPKKELIASGVSKGVAKQLTQHSHILAKSVRRAQQLKAREQFGYQHSALHGFLESQRSPEKLADNDLFTYANCIIGELNKLDQDNGLIEPWWLDMLDSNEVDDVERRIKTLLMSIVERADLIKSKIESQLKQPAVTPGKLNHNAKSQMTYYKNVKNLIHSLGSALALFHERMVFFKVLTSIAEIHNLDLQIPTDESIEASIKRISGPLNQTADMLTTYQPSNDRLPSLNDVSLSLNIDLIIENTDSDDAATADDTAETREEDEGQNAPSAKM